jgi:hypothetical protein
MSGVWQMEEPRYDATHVPTMVVCCSDGRFVEATQDFLRSQGLGRHDLMAIPGGIAEALYEREVPGGALSGAQATELLAKLHHTNRIILLAHADCGYYIQRLGASDADRQKEDLSRAAEWLALRIPEVTVDTYYIRPAEEDEGTGFVIEEV